MPGQLYHEDIDAATYAEWGIDYLKSDNCASYALDSSVRFGAMRDALNRTGAKIVLSIEPFSINHKYDDHGVSHSFQILKN